MRELPTLSVLQILILDTMGAGETQSGDLREKLKAAGFRKSAPAFYQAMTRLEDAGLVESRFTTDRIDGKTVREKHFKVTAEGVRALGEAQDFFDGLEVAAPPARPEKAVAKSALSRVLKNFFEGSVEKAVAAHLSDPNSAALDPAELDRLSNLIEEAKQKGNRAS